MNRRLFHFTSSLHLPPIRQDGMLRPTESNVSPYIEHAGPRVVWLTDLEEIPADAPPNYLGLSEIKREVRFEVNVQGIRWEDWPPSYAMSPSWRETFLKVAGGPEVAQHLFVWPGPIRKYRWVSIREGASA